MNLWGGRFAKPTNQLVYDFNASIKFDKTFASQDIKGSIGHVKMLTKQEILTQEEGQLIEKTLKEILNEVENGTLETALQEIETTIYFVEHVKDRERLCLKNIF